MAIKRSMCDAMTMFHHFPPLDRGRGTVPLKLVTRGRVVRCEEGKAAIESINTNSEPRARAQP
jgi:hypothetical protein